MWCMPCLLVSDQTSILVLTCICLAALLSGSFPENKTIWIVLPPKQFPCSNALFKNPAIDFCGLTVGCFPLCPTHWASRVEVIGGYHEYTDVKSCQDVVHLYHLLWSATILNIVALFLGIITAAVLGGFKDMVSLTLSVWLFAHWQTLISLILFMVLPDTFSDFREFIWTGGDHRPGPLGAPSADHLHQIVLQHCPLPATLHGSWHAGTTHTQSVWIWSGRVRVSFKNMYLNKYRLVSGG